MDNTERKTVIKIENLYKTYLKNGRDENSQEVPVLKGMNFEVKDGEFVSIMGKSGSGKTTLLKILGLIERPTGGKYLIDGRDASQLWEDELSDLRRRDIGFVFQDFNLMDSLNVQENIMLPMVLDKGDAEECFNRSRQLAEQVGIEHLLAKNVFELSGGERQRVAICRALMNSPSVILADEPTGSLDSKSGQQVIDLLCQVNKEMGKTVVMVTHDAKMASYADRRIFVRDGLVVDAI